MVKYGPTNEFGLRTVGPGFTSWGRIVGSRVEHLSRRLHMVHRQKKGLRGSKVTGVSPVVIEVVPKRIVGGLIRGTREKEGLLDLN